MKIKNKLLVYLDTSDFVRLSKQGITNEDKSVKTFLESMVNEGRIVIPNSYPLMAEFIHYDSDELKNERLERARLIKRLCRNYAFEFIPNNNYSSGLNNHGIWSPRLNVSAKNIFKKMSAELERHPHFNVFAKDMLHPRKRILLTKNHPYIFNTPNEMIAQSKNALIEYLTEKDNVLKLISNKISIKDFNREIEKTINDPEKYVYLVHKLHPLLTESMQRFHKLSLFIEEQINNLETQLEKFQQDIKKLSAQKKSLLSSSISHAQKQEVKNLYKMARDKMNTQNLATTYCNKDNNILPGYLYKILDVYFHAHLKNPSFKCKKSDAGDITHALFLPHTDLWRGDTTFSKMLIDNDIDYKFKIVPNLLELPERINNHTR